MNLKELQRNSEKTIKQVAEELNLPFSTYNNYLIGTREPNIETLIKLSKYFNVSIDYILGNDTKGMTVYTEEQNQIIKMMVQLNEINLLKLYSYTAGLLSAQG